MKKPGRVLISNSGTNITAFRFFGNIREALVSLKSLPRLVKRAYGAVLFDSNARLEHVDAAVSQVSDH